MASQEEWKIRMRELPEESAKNIGGEYSSFNK